MRIRPRLRLARASRAAATAAALLAGGVAVAAGPALPAAGAAPSPERRAQLRALVLQDCGSCHGMRLTGGLGTPLTAQALRDKPAEVLEAAVLQGRPGTAMPPWSGLLTDVEAAWIVARLKDGSFTDER